MGNGSTKCLPISQLRNYLIGNMANLRDLIAATSLVILLKSEPNQPQCDLEIWHYLEKQYAPFSCHFKLCVSFLNHLWIHTGVMVRKCPNWSKICFDLSDLNLWPWPLAWTSLLSLVIISENFRWFDDNNIMKRVWRMDGQTDRTIHKAALSQLNMKIKETEMLRWLVLV